MTSVVFPYSLVITEDINRSFWPWLDKHIGQLFIDYDARWVKKDPRKDSDKEDFILLFKTAEDKAQFILTWM